MDDRHHATLSRNTHHNEIDEMLKTIQVLIDEQTGLTESLRRNAIKTDDSSKKGRRLSPPLTRGGQPVRKGTASLSLDDIIILVYLISCSVCILRISMSRNINNLQSFRWEHLYCLMILSAVVQICSSHKQNAANITIIPT